jgi:hypothetical protein
MRKSVETVKIFVKKRLSKFKPDIFEREKIGNVKINLKTKLKYYYLFFLLFKIAYAIQF